MTTNHLWILRGGVATYCPTCEKETEAWFAAGKPTLTPSSVPTAAPTKGDVQGGRLPPEVMLTYVTRTGQEQQDISSLPLMNTEGTEGFW